MTLLRTCLSSVLAFLTLSAGVHAQSTPFADHSPVLLRVVAQQIARGLLTQGAPGGTCLLRRDLPQQGGTFGVTMKVDVLNRAGEVVATVTLTSGTTGSAPLLTRAQCTVTATEASVTLYTAGGDLFSYQASSTP